MHCKNEVYKSSIIYYTSKGVFRKVIMTSQLSTFSFIQNTVGFCSKKVSNFYYERSKCATIKGVLFNCICEFCNLVLMNFANM